MIDDKMADILTNLYSTTTTNCNCCA